MNHFLVESVNEIQVQLCRSLLAEGKPVDPRGLETLELLGVSFELSNPRNRLTTIEERNWSAALAVAELAWHLRGDDDVAALEFYAPQWRQFADPEGRIRGSCYGQKVFGVNSSGSSQWENVKKLLSSESASRRAVLNFRFEIDVSEESNDISCTNSIQFIVRDQKLHAFVSMRSNDVIWGLPYDLFLFSVLQEMMAVELQVNVGSYFHAAASMHVYKRHYALAERMAKSRLPLESGAMPPITSSTEAKRLAEVEEELRTGRRVSHDDHDGFLGVGTALLRRHKMLRQVA